MADRLDELSASIDRICAEAFCKVLGYDPLLEAQRHRFTTDRRLSRQEIKEILRLRSEGKKLAAIAIDVGCSESTVWRQCKKHGVRASKAASNG